MELVSNFKNRLIEEMKEQNIKQVDLCKMTGISKSLMSKYINGVSDANNKNTALIAKALNVNVAWLVGYDVPKNFEAIKKEIQSYVEYTELSELIKSLTPKQKEQVVKFIKEFILNNDET